ncbi:MAG: protein kinase [Candidatus Methylomirabilales bacterium]
MGGVTRRSLPILFRFRTPAPAPSPSSPRPSHPSRALPSALLISTFAWPPDLPEEATGWLAGARGLLAQPGLLRLAGGVALGILVLWAVGRLLLRPRGGRPPSRRGLARSARRAAWRGDHLDAGRLFEAAEEWEAAARAYEKAQAFSQAARLWEQQNRLAQAATLFEQANDLSRAAELYARLGVFAKAATLFQKAGQDVRAAEALERAGELERAAALFAKYDAFERAGDLKSRLGQAGPAAELLERALAQRRVRAARGDEAAAEGLKLLARRAAEQHAAAGRPARAAAVLREYGLEEEAAERYCQAGDWQAGLELLLRHRRFERAAEICRAQGLREQGHLVEGERAAAEGREADAGSAFEAAGLWWRAGEMYQRVGDYGRAAAMFARQGDEERAAEMHAAAGQPAEAAAALERLGRREEAAAYYRQAGALPQAARALRDAGDLYGAAELLLEAKADEEAILLLQQVPPGSPKHLEALLHLGDLFLAQGLDGPAREQYEQALRIRGSGPTAVRAAYQLGVVRERQGDLAEALRCFEKVMAAHLDYRDVQARVADLRSRQAEAATMVVGPRPTARYRILKELGRGGMGIVYRAEDEVLQRTVAYKVLPDTIRQDAKAMEAFLQEARIAASLHHPNIVTVYDAGQTAEQAYIAMEFVEGRSLQEILDEQQLLPLPMALHILRQACLSLIHAHERQVVHRDVKPANMMITPGGAVKLTDFGLAAVATQAMGRVTSIRGTPFYMAPEQILGEPISAQSDQYSLGCTLYHLVTGRPPFVEGDVLYHHIHTAPASPRDFVPGLPVWLDAIILRTLLKPPAKRFPSVAVLLKEVDRCLAAQDAPR